MGRSGRKNGLFGQWIFVWGKPLEAKSVGKWMDLHGRKMNRRQFIAQVLKPIVQKSPCCSRFPIAGGRNESQRVSVQFNYCRMNKIEIRPKFLRFDGHIFLKHVKKFTIIAGHLRRGSVACYQAFFTRTSASEPIRDLRSFNVLLEPTVVDI